MVLTLTLLVGSSFLIHKKDTITVRELSFGTYKTTGETETSEQSPSGRHTVLTNYTHIKTTDTIDAVLGETFGVEYMVVSKKKKAISLERVWKLPGEIIDGKGRKFKEIRRNIEVITNENLINTYEFEEDFELALGKWTFSLSYENKLLYERSFNVVKR